MIETDADRLALVKPAGEPFVYFDGETAIEVHGIFRRAHQRVEGGRGAPSVASRRPELDIPLDVITEPKQGDLLFRGELADFAGDFDYEVVSPQPDETEKMATLILKAVV